MTMSATTKKNVNNNNSPPKALPVGYVPQPNDVVIGRGKKVDQHNQSNFLLQSLLSRYASDYFHGSRDHKSEILTRVIHEICHGAGAHSGFIKLSPVDGRWCQVDEKLKRSTAAQSLRNHLCDKYKSSKQFKRKIRHEKKRESLNLTPTSDESLQSQEHLEYYPLPRRVSLESNKEDKLKEAFGDHAMGSNNGISGKFYDPESQDLVKMDLFSMLSNQFSVDNVDPEDNPFCPRPIAPTAVSSVQGLLEPLKLNHRRGDEPLFGSDLLNSLLEEEV